MGTTIRVGVIGAGTNTRLRHIPGLQGIEGVEIVGVCNRSRQSSERVAEEFGLAKVWDGWTDVIADEDVDAVVVGTWPYMHCRITLAALDVGKHVLTEARMAMNAREAHTMLAAARAKPHIVTQIVPSPMTLTIDRTIQRLIADGYLGEVLAVEHRLGGSFLDDEARLHWRQNVDYSGLNVLMLGIYYEAIMRWVGEATRVCAMGKTFVRMRRDEEDIERAVRVPEHVDVVADLACGAQLHMQQSAVTGLIGDIGTYVFGSDGVLRIVDDTLYAARKGDSRLEPINVPTDERHGWRVEEEFIGAIRGEEEIEFTTFEDGVKYMEFTEAVARSLATGRAVPLPLTLDAGEV